MGDYFERIVDVEVTAEEAGPLAERMVEWMVSEGLLTREMSGDGMYSRKVEEGYVPGPNWQRTAHDWGSDWIPGPVAVIVGRESHIGGQGEIEPESATCPRCETKTVIIDYPEEFEADDEVWQPFQGGIDAWKEAGEGSAACSTCGEAVPVTEWQWSSGFDLGALAFEFWGWPPLDVDFLAEFGRQLGHRTEEQSGKF
ncbi:hypothetical protein [Streptomyces sp. NPDC000410]|uniref:hypothetical protein n=1 Tax=Streptomyces sp. NPDC000410 TaxID=3154254 RepID=UPI00332554F6